MDFYLTTSDSTFLCLQINWVFQKEKLFENLIAVITVCSLF